MYIIKYNVLRLQHVSDFFRSSSGGLSYRYKKGKAIPLQALTGPEGSRRLRLPDFKTVGT
jgi:hypothetical protein